MSLRKRAASVLVVLALIVLVMPGAATAAESPQPVAAETLNAKLGDGVREAIRDNGVAHVIVTFGLPDASLATPTRTLDQLRADVASTQATFLDAMDSFLSLP